MEDKKSFGSKLEAFFAGKGFYIVLLLCVTVIGISAWSMLKGDTDRLLPEDGALAVDRTDAGEAVPAAATREPLILEAAGPAAAPAPTAAPTPAPAPAPTAAPAPAPTAAPTAVPASVQTSGKDAPDIPATPAAAINGSYFVWPVIGETCTGYAMSSLIYDRTMRDWRTHDGIDVAAALGTRVRAVTGGVVSGVIEDPGYGTTVVLDHGDGLCSIYANLAATPSVTPGEAVAVGQIIGAVGDTALCEIGEVSHLHFAMTWNGESVDPGDYLP